ncbi:hypothetical protein [Micromonospora echinospora]|uniref:hypothetical protein n=2 Tax=Micromonospora TaxID=1873 RepID=UPI003A8B7B3D
MTRVRKLGMSAAAFAMTAGALLAPGSPAQAASCSVGGNIGVNGGSGWATCTGVTSARVQVRCEENSGAQYTAYGPWVGAGVQSRARCHEYAWVVTVGAQYT